MDGQIKSFTDANGRKGGFGDWVRNLETGEIITVQSIENHGRFGVTLASGSLITRDRLDVKAKRAVIVKTAKQVANVELYGEK